jgi:hypothetical protein
LHPTVDAEFVNAYVSEFGDETDKQKLDSGKWLDSLNNFNFDIFIDKNTYQVAKMTLSFASKQDSSLLSPVMEAVPGISSGDVQVAAVLKVSDYNKLLTVDVPTDVKSWQDVFADFTTTLMSTESATLLNPTNQLQQARDTRRRADLLGITNAIYQYAAEHNGKLPVSDTTAFPTKEICVGTNAFCFDLAHAGEVNSTIVPKYIALMPKDPKNGTDSDTKYTIYMDATGRLQAKAVSESDHQNPIIVTR